MMQDQHIPGSFGGDLSKIKDETRLECKICWYVYDPEKEIGRASCRERV